MTHSVVTKSLTTADDDQSATTEALASMEFEAWIPGLEEEMTPVNLTEAANGGPFLATFLAYKTMFRTKAELVESWRSCPEAGAELVETISDGATWFEQIASLMRAAAGRHMSALATTEIESHAPSS